MRKLIFLVFFLSISAFAQSASNVFTDKKAVEYLVIVAGWFTNEKCSILPNDQKAKFKQNFDAANRVLSINSSEQEMKKFNSFISQQISKNKCDTASTELVNKSLQIAQNFKQPSSSPIGTFSNKSAIELYNVTLAINIENKCRFLDKDQNASLTIGYMALAQTIDKDYGSNSSTGILGKLAVSDAMNRNISCSPSERDFSKKVAQVMRGK